jgi:transposase
MQGVDETMIKAEGKQIYLACGQTDMRKSINGLSAIVKYSFRLDPFQGAIFVFCNRKRDRLKILEWDGDGFWLHMKILERGHFKWPKETDDEKTMRLSPAELANLIGGPGLEQKLRRKQIINKLIL